MTDTKTTRQIDCDEARTLVRTFAGGSIPASKGRILRAHLLGCPDCKAFYRETVEVAASLGQGVRAEREAQEAKRRNARREENRKVALGTTPATIRTGRPDRFALRTILVPAFFFFLMVWLTKFGASQRIYLVESQGTIWIDGKPTSSEKMKLKRGDWCLTESSSRAVLELGDSKLTIFGDSHVLVEDPATRRLRFRSGEVRAEGSQEITTSFGVLAVEEGTQRLSYLNGSFELACDSGRAVFSDASGDTVLEPGDLLVRGLR